jgi:hypothetical protein
VDMGVKRTNHRRFLATLAAVAVTIGVGASAASLGGIESNQLGADTGVVASCDDNGIDVLYRTAYHRRSGELRVNRVILRNVSAQCQGLPYQLTLVGAAGTPYEVDGTSLLVTNLSDRDPGPGIDLAGISRIRVRFPMENVDGIALTIGGGPAAP